MPTPASGHAYTAFGHSFPLLQMLAGGDYLLGDLRMIHGDSVLRRLLPLARVPSTDATGDWLRRMGKWEGSGKSEPGKSADGGATLAADRAQEPYPFGGQAGALDWAAVDDAEQRFLQALLHAYHHRD
ncbi:hypothetical protein MQE22_00545 [Acidithiobacillus sp. YTS05]|nr:hypothetical protein MQE22_00545 [Acidithiobacillus sp. YTS05]